MTTLSVYSMAGWRSAIASTEHEGLGGRNAAFQQRLELQMLGFITKGA